MFTVTYENKEQVKLTHRQQRLVVQIVRGHTEDRNFTGKIAVTVTRYFVSVWTYYYPHDAVGNPYLAELKHFFIGPKGAIQKAKHNSGVGHESNIKGIARYYFTAAH